MPGSQSSGNPTLTQGLAIGRHSGRLVDNSGSAPAGLLLALDLQPALGYLAALRDIVASGVQPAERSISDTGL